MLKKRSQFYVYENLIAEGHKAKIHRAECSFCNYGKGIHGTDNIKHGQWLGPFETFADARQAASKTKGTISVCKFCGPEGPVHTDL